MPSASAPGHIADDARPRVVLDTQVVLDWLVFRDAGCAALQTALETRSVFWLATPAMRNELEHVLGRDVALAWGANRSAIAQAFDRYACMIEPGTAPYPPLRCTDPDDQMFIDLALNNGVRWLFTRDRALLALARRARLHGVTVLPPAAWSPQAMQVLSS